MQLQPLLRLDRPCSNRCAERCIVSLVQIRVRHREVGDSAIEDVALAEIRADRDAVAGARMRTCERPPACMRKELEPSRQDRLEVDGALPVPELPNEEVSLDAVEAALVPDPAEEDVARCLHQALPFDHSLPVVRKVAATE